MRNSSRFIARPTWLAACLVAGSAFLASTASAAPVQAGVGSYNLGTDVAAGATASPQTACGTGGQDALIFTGAAGNNIGIHSYSCGLGLYEFGSRSSGENTYYVDGMGSVTGEITISGGFSYHISPGQVGAFGSASFTPGEYQYAELVILLQFADDSGTYTFIDQKWTVLSDHTGVTDTAIGAGPVGSSYTSGPGYGSFAIQGHAGFISSLDLPDGDYDITYEISTKAHGRVLGTTACRAVIGDGGHGGEEGLAAAVQFEDGRDDGSFASYCGAGAQSGDPFNSAIARALPEPGSLGLLGLAAALLGLRSAKRRQRAG